MEKLSIGQASEQFNISRARLYQLLEKGAVVGYRSEKKGRGAGSWIDRQSLCTHIHENPHGGPKIMPEGDYLPIRIAAKNIKYTVRHINRLVKAGSVASKKVIGGYLVHYPSLLKYLNQ